MQLLYSLYRSKQITKGHIPSVIRQKGESQNGGNKKKKQSTPNFPKKQLFPTPDMHTFVCVSRGKKCSFFGKFGVLCFLVTSVLKFAFLPYYRRYNMQTIFMNTENCKTNKPHIFRLLLAGKPDLKNSNKNIALT